MLSVTLGSDSSFTLESGSFYTLGSDTLNYDFDNIGSVMSSARFKSWSRVRSGLRTGSTTFELDSVVEGGCVSKFIMSDAAFFKSP